jgi:predicted aldo/keto reductase-like oxidoreductase
MSSINRRNFLYSSLAGMALAAAPGWADRRNGMPYRSLGKTGEMVSLLGVGGYHIGVDSLSDEESIALMRTAVDGGINFFDNAWAYHDGRSEIRMGKALKDGYRDQVFLMTKGHARDAAGAQRYLEESLRRLQVDTIDLWQIHEIVRPESPQAIYDEGVLDYLVKAREAGKIRYIGFTGHHITSTHLDMMARGFPFDTVQMPMGVVDYHFRSFQQRVLGEALNREMGILAMKTLGGGRGTIPKSGAATAAECLRYAMSLPVSTVISGMRTLDELQANLETAKSFQPYTEKELVALRARTKAVGEDGALEPHKTAWHKDIQARMAEQGLTPS